ncbi:MAG: sulfotransferase, partial [Burkholderiales bacterium]|nr:sulfotransferase [Burkholderiales bacterium]
KIIVSLRNPVERAYSSFFYAKSYGLEPLRTFAEGIEAEPQRIRDNCSILLRYRDLGLYAKQLSRYYDVFPRDQIKVILFEDFIQDPAQIVSN